MVDQSKASFAIIRHNFRAYEGHDVVEVVRGQAAAERAVDRHDRKLTQQEKDVGGVIF